MDEVREEVEDITKYYAETLPDKGDVVTSGGATLYYEYELLRRGGPFTSAVYRTHIWLVSGKGKYKYGTYGGKLSREGLEWAIRGEAEEKQQQYGQTTTSRQSLTPIRERSKTLNPRTAINAGYKPYG